MRIGSCRGGSLSAALHIPKGMTCFVGGGGKTSAVFRIANELCGSARVLIATTTRIYSPCCCGLLDPSSPEEIRHYFDRYEPGGLLCVGRSDINGKITSPTMNITELTELCDYLLVEADGAKMRPLKAAAAHEPVVPPSAALVVGVMGLSALDRTINEIVFRPELLCRMTGAELSDPVTENHFAITAADPVHGLKKALPPDARFSLLLNQADTDGTILRALRIAKSLPEGAADTVIITSLRGTVC